MIKAVSIYVVHHVRNLHATRYFFYIKFNAGPLQESYPLTTVINKVQYLLLKLTPREFKRGPTPPCASGVWGASRLRLLSNLANPARQRRGVVLRRNWRPNTEQGCCKQGSHGNCL